MLAWGRGKFMSSNRKQENIVIKNNAGFTVYVRAYDVSEPKELIVERVVGEGFSNTLNNYASPDMQSASLKLVTSALGVGDIVETIKSVVALHSNTFTPISNVTVIPKDKEVVVTIDTIDKADAKTQIYYVNATSIEEARTLLSKTGPASELLIDGSYNNFIPYKESGPDIIEPIVLKIPAFTQHVITKHKLLKAIIDDSEHQTGLMSPELHDDVERGVQKKRGKYIAEFNMQKPTIDVANEKSGDIKLSNNENKFIKERDKITRDPLRNLAEKALGDALPNDASLPRIGLCGSGGGFRAMLSFHGFQTALQEQGLFDMIHFVSGTSGSTWAMADIMAFNGKPEEFTDYLRSYPERIKEGMSLGIYSEKEFSEVKEMYKKLLTERLSGSDKKDPKVEDHLNDILMKWTVRLSNAALSGIRLDYQNAKGNQKEDMRTRSLSKTELNPTQQPLSIINMLASQAVEAPNSTKITVHHGRVEVTKMDTTYVAALEDRGKKESPASRTETKNLGVYRKNDDVYEGTPVNISFASAFAVAGSAITVDIYKIAAEVPAVMELLEKIGHFDATGTASRTPVPGIIPGYPINRAVADHGETRMWLRDAGIDYNLPMYPLMRPERNCGVVVVLDASGDLATEPGTELFKAIRDARTLGRKISPEFLGLDSTKLKEVVTLSIKDGRFPIVFGNPADPDELCIVYVPCVKQCVKLLKNNMLKDYNPELLTTKLDYDEDELTKLHVFGRELGTYVSAGIKEVIVRRILAMNSKLALAPSKEVDIANYIIQTAKAGFVSKEALNIYDYQDKKVGDIINALSGKLSDDIEDSQNENLIYIIDDYLKYRETKNPIVLNILNNKFKFLVTRVINGKASTSDLISLLQALSSPIATRSFTTSENINVRDIIIENIGSYIISPETKCSEETKNLFNDVSGGKNKRKTHGELSKKKDSEIAVTLLKDKDINNNNRISSLLSLVVRTRESQYLTVFFMNLYKYLLEQPSDLNIKLNLEQIIQGLLNECKNKLIEACEKGNVVAVRDYLSVDGVVSDNLIFKVAGMPYVPVLELVVNTLNKEQKYILYKNRKGWNAIHKAIAKDNVDNIEFLYKTRPELMSERTGRGTVTDNKAALQAFSGTLNGLDTAAILAVRHQAYGSLKFLFDNKIELNERDQNNFSPLCWAYYNYDLKAFVMLLGADAKRKIEYGNSKNTLLQEACKDKRVKFVKALLRAGVGDKLDEKNPDDYTPLCLAYYQSRLSQASSAVSSAASYLASKVSFTKEASMVPSNNDDLEIFKILLEAGANPNIIYGTSNNTLLHTACKDDRVGFVQALLEENVDIKQLEPERDHEKYSSLCWAYKNNNIRIFKMLLNASANPNIKYGTTKNTLLQEACKDKRSDFIAALLAALFERNVAIKQIEKDNGIDSLLSLAYTNKDIAVFEMLLNAGDEPKIKYGKSEKTLLNEACKDKRSDFVAALLAALLKQNVGIQQIEKENDTGSLLCWAYTNKDLTVFKMLLNADDEPKIQYGKSNKTLLYEACKDKRSDFVEALLAVFIKNKVAIKQLENENDTGSLLCWAYTNKDITVFKMLLEAGADPNIKYDKSKNTLLHEACKENRSDFVEALLSAKVDIKQLEPERNHEKYSPLCLAYKNDNIKLFKILLNAGANPNIKYGATSNTLLHEACKDNRSDFVEALLNAKVDIKQLEPERDHEKYSPLCLAYKNNNIKIFEMLLNAGANPNIKYGTSNNILLHEACKDRRVEFVKALLKKESVIKQLNERNQDKHSPLCVAYYQSRLSQAKSALSSAVSSRASTALPMFSTPVQSSGPIEMMKSLGKKVLSNNDDLEIFKILLEAGANPNITYGGSTIGNTILHESCEDVRKEFVEKLLAYDADISCPNNKKETPNQIAERKSKPIPGTIWGSTPASDDMIEIKNMLYGKRLYDAATDGNLKSVNSLIAADANLDFTTHDGVTPLISALVNDHIDVFNLLLSKGANQNIATKKGLTPLHFAAQENNTDVIKALLDRRLTIKTDLNQTSLTGETPLVIAVYKGNIDVVTLLLDAGADPNISNSLYRAAQNGNLEMCQLLINKRASLSLSFTNSIESLRTFANDHGENVRVRMDELIKETSTISITPSEIALVMGHKEVHELLLRQQSLILDRSLILDSLYSPSFFRVSNPVAIQVAKDKSNVVTPGSSSSQQHSKEESKKPPSGNKL